MANSIKFVDNSAQCKEEIRQKGIKWLYEACQVLLKQIIDLYRADTGQTRNSFDYVVDEGGLEATIGSPMENAIWEEFGTGIYAENGNGRKTAWSYKDSKGKWHKTNGKKGTKAFRRSFDVRKKQLQDLLNNELGDMK